MKKLVASILENLSTREAFIFRVSCAGCGTQYTSRPVRFSKADRIADTPAKKILFDAVFDQEQETARHCAIRSAAEHMNHCPICNRIVCDRCFLICDDLDMCRQCAAELNEQGKPVSPSIIEAAM